MKLIGEVALILLVYVVKFSDQSKMYCFFSSQSKSTALQKFTKLHFRAATSGTCIFFINDFFSMKFVWFFFS